MLQDLAIYAISALAILFVIGLFVKYIETKKGKIEGIPLDIFVIFFVIIPVIGLAIFIFLISRGWSPSGWTITIIGTVIPLVILLLVTWLSARGKK